MELSSNVTLKIANEFDLPQLEKLIHAYHAFEDITSLHGDISAAILPLLGESDHGRIWLINTCDSRPTK